MSDTKLTFLGVGSAFAKKNYRTNLLIENKGESLLIDCGGSACQSLYEMEKPLTDINNIFITHLHGDHIHGLEEIGFMNMFVFNKKPKLISTINIHNVLWDNGLKAGMNSIQYQLTVLKDFFDVETLVHNDNQHGAFSRAGLRFELVRTDHIYIEKKFDIPSYGLIIEDPVSGRKALYTSDTKHDYRSFEHLFKYVDVIFHDCQLFDQPNAVHATYNELKSLPDDIRAKMWLMHYGDNFEDFDPVADGFKGFVKQQYEYNFDEV